MTEDEILDDIKIILEAKSAMQASIPGTNLRIPKVDETIPLLGKLSSRLTSQEERNLFWQILNPPFIKEISSFLPFPILKASKSQEVKKLIFNYVNDIFVFYVKSGKINDALNYFEIERNIDNRSISVLESLAILLKNEPMHFDKATLVRVETYMSKLREQILKEINYEDKKDGGERIVAINGVSLEKPLPIAPPPKPRDYYVAASIVEWKRASNLVEYIIVEVKFAKLNIVKASYEGINWEINQDKEELRKRINEFGFNPKLNECLNQFDIEYQQGNEFNFKSAIGHIRSFLEKLMFSIAERIYEQTRIKPGCETIKKFGEARDYLFDKRINFLSEIQNDVIIAFYALASDKEVGSHALTSDREHARLIRNIVIEEGLFLVQRLEKYLNKNL